MSIPATEHLKSPVKNTGIPQTPPRNPVGSFGRMENCTKTTHVRVQQHTNGTATCTQYMPENHPLYRPAIIHSPAAGKTLAETFSTPNGKNHAFNLEVNTPNGTALVAKRFIDISLQLAKDEKKEAEHSMLCIFSKKENHPASVIPMPIAMNTASEPDVDKENMPPIKGGQAIDIALCDRNRKQARSQKQVKGEAAKAVFLKYIEDNKHKYDEDTYAILIALVENNSFEWLHCLAFRLCPTWFDPQVPENLGAAPKWVNTYMMVLEGVAAAFAKNPDNKVIVISRFKMLKDSPELIEEIFYSVSITDTHSQRKVTLSNTIPALVFKNSCTLPANTDMPQATHVAKALLAQRPPSLVRSLRFE